MSGKRYFIKVLLLYYKFGIVYYEYYLVLCYKFGRINRIAIKSEINHANFFFRRFFTIYK